jgi:catechol 2,3-dioxygenase-like lactoylglutathione lyase family enzyme
MLPLVAERDQLQDDELMANGFQLNEHPLIAFVPTCDPDRAKTFYRDLLGLRLVSEQLPFALVFDAHGTMLRVVVVKELTPPPYTTLGWEVADIQDAVATLAARGIRFQRYPNMKQDHLGIWTAPGGSKVAWFRDPDGNTLSLSQS